MPYKPEIEPWPDDFKGQLPVSEVFYSIQGEGRFAGHPALFIRLMHCNLGCAWCDTAYTWEKNSIDSSQLLSPDETADMAIQKLPADVDRGKVHVVLTGGEPMLHQDRLPSLIDALKANGLDFVEIETNGTLEPTDELLKRISWWNCSPKLSNSGISAKKSFAPQAVKKIQATGKADFKFVIQTRRDLEEIEVKFLPLVPKELIMLMPEGTTPERLKQVSGWLMDECSQRGYRFSPRLHIMTWGNERGR